MSIKMNLDIVENQIKEEVAKEFGNFTNDSAMMIAYERGLETEKGTENSLFQDPFAKFLQGPKGKQLSKDFGANASAVFGFPGWEEFHITWTAVRTKFIDDQIKENTKKEGCEIKQLVNLGSGLDTRAHRLECYKSFKNVFDVDMAQINEMKTKIFDVLKTNRRMDKSYCENLANISMDFLDETKNLVNELTKANFSKDDPTIFVAEGLIMYLGGGKPRFLKEVSDAAAPGSVLILNFMQHSDDVEGAKMEYYMSLEDMKNTLVNEGWDKKSFKVNRFGDDVLNYGMFPNDKFQKSYSFSFLVCHKNDIF